MAMKTLHLSYGVLATILACLVIFSSGVHAECTCECDQEEEKQHDKSKALSYKVAAIVSILVAGAIGVCLPGLGKTFQALRPEKNIFFIIKAFAAGVILSTGFIHILPDAFDKLSSPCLCHPWCDFPFTGLLAMVGAIGTLMIDAFATMYFQNQHFDGKSEAHVDDVQTMTEGHEGHVHLHTHATHGHAHGSDHHHSSDTSTNLLRQRVISQVLELGIIVHSVIIGISLGASQNLKTIRPLVAALTFHQFFEGMGLGSCISQAKFKRRAVVVMTLFFSLTTPAGIAIGILITNNYDENRPHALIVEGTLNAVAAGILIYMSLVDLLAVDFMSPRMQNNLKLHLGANLSLLFGAGCMSLLAKWA